MSDSLQLNYVTSPIKSLSGRICVPGDKSISHRALILCSIAEGVSEIRNLLMGEDCLATLAALRQLGVQIEQVHENNFRVYGVGLFGLQSPKKMLNLGNSGTSMRLLAGLLVGQKFNSALTGDDSLQLRPMARIANPLRTMGANIELTPSDTAPIKILGNPNMNGIDYTLPVASAQVKSCLLLAGIYANSSTTIIEPVATRDHTERMLLAMHYPLAINENKISLAPKALLKAVNIDVPSDISSAAFFMVAATITPNSKLELTNVCINPTRMGVIHILRAMGANIELKNIRMQGGEHVADVFVQTAPLHGIEIAQEFVASAIDEFPAIFIAAACAEGKTTLKNAQELRVKETDRLAVMAEGLVKLGIQCEVLPDGIVIEGGKFNAGTVDSHGDHRVAMAFAVAGCVARKQINILNCTNVNTSFPNFLELAKEVGFQLAEDYSIHNPQSSPRS